MPDSPFLDIEYHWAKASILQLTQKGWLIGGKNQQFRPDDGISRAEFAALLPWVFPTALPLHPTPRFRDVSDRHVASRAIAWAAERGLLTGYPDRTFRPRQPLTRTQAFVTVMRGLHLPAPVQDPATILADYFDDASEVLAMAQGAIATAAIAGLVVSNTEIRRLRPAAPMTRGELAGLFDRMLTPATPTPSVHATSSMLLKDIQHPIVVPLSALRGNPPLVREIQTKLHRLRLHPGEEAINGQYSARTEAALLEFCRVLELPQRQSCTLDHALAQTLLNASEVCFALTTARDRPRVFQEFLRQEAGFSGARLAFLDRGLEDSSYRDEVPTYPGSFRLIPDGQTIRSLEESLIPRGQTRPVTLRPFPAVGQLPAIDTTALNFLHEDIPQACLCISSLVGGELKSRWLGRNALQNVQMWSATKFIPLLHIAARINTHFPDSDLDDCRVRSRSGRGFRFFDMAQDLVSYDNSIGSSNPVAALFKQFDTPANLEGWVRRMTGNQTLQFRGRYGSNPTIAVSEIWDERLQQVVLRSAGVPHQGRNLMSAYDLTRLIAMLGWHLYLPDTARLPGAQWHSLETLVRVLGHDSARYVDVAIDRLGLTHLISSPVILSKMGFGQSGERNRTELVYTALVQFIDASRCSVAGDRPPPVLRMLSLTLVAARDRPATHLDARLAAEMTEILRRVVTQELV